MIKLSSPMVDDLKVEEDEEIANIHVRDLKLFKSKLCTGICFVILFLIFFSVIGRVKFLG